MQKLIGTIVLIVMGLSFNTKPAGKGIHSSPVERETVEYYKDLKGEIRQVGVGDAYMIWCGEKYLKLNPFNLAKEYKQPGLQVTFSGNVKMTNTLEDEMGDLFEVTAMRR